MLLIGYRVVGNVNVAVLLVHKYNARQLPIGIRNGGFVHERKRFYRLRNYTARMTNKAKL